MIIKSIKTIKKLTGKIVVRTGLRIGGASESMEIGGVDMPILRNKIDSMPYIPGSSLKGRMRALLEWHLGLLSVDENKPVHQCEDGEKAMSCPICRVFGVSADKKYKFAQTRLIVRDCFLSKEWQNRADIVEVKVENNISRITAKATPRSIERVVPGVSFDLDIAYRVIDCGDDGKKDLENFDKVVLKALALVERDYLGGCGSRGCGKVEFILKDESDPNKNLNLADYLTV